MEKASVSEEQRSIFSPASKIAREGERRASYKQRESQKRRPWMPGIPAHMVSSCNTLSCQAYSSNFDNRQSGAGKAHRDRGKRIPLSIFHCMHILPTSNSLTIKWRFLFSKHVHSNKALFVHSTNIDSFTLHWTLDVGTIVAILQI